MPVFPPDLRVDESHLERILDRATPGGHNLFVYPAQSNFSGVQHPLEWIATAQARGWDVLLDAAAFVPTNRLDLSRAHPDFVALSCYKMFGHPTGVGVLIAKRSALEKLDRPWFSGGGRFSVASVQGNRHFLAEGVAAFISLRTGCFCNPVAGEVALGLSAGALDRCFAGRGDRMTKDDFGRCLEGGKSPGAVRLSLGLASTFADAHTFIRFAAHFLR